MFLKGESANFFFLFLAISSSNLHEIQKVRSVLKSACSQLFKTVLTFEFWPSRSWDIGARTHQGSFSFCTFSINFIVLFYVISKKSLFLAFFFVKSSIICVGNVRESNEGCQIEVLKVWKSDYNCWNWIIWCEIQVKNEQDQLV